MMVPIKVPEEDIEQKKYRDRKKEVRKDTATIQGVITSDDEEVLIEVHREIDGKYGAYIQNWAIGMYNYIPDIGFDYEFTSTSALIHNLKLMKAKIEGSILFQENSAKMSNSPNVITTINNNNVINNQIDINIAIDEAKERIEDLTALPKEQIDEINSKLEELRKIVDSKDKKTTKWEKAKPIFKYIIDKGLDVAKIVLPLINKV